METTRPDDGRPPLMQVGTLVITLGLILGVLGAGIALMVGNFPPEFNEFAQTLAKWGSLGAAVGIGLTAVGKGLYEIGAGRYAAEVGAAMFQHAPASPVTVQVGSPAIGGDVQTGPDAPLGDTESPIGAPLEGLEPPNPS